MNVPQEPSGAAREWSALLRELRRTARILAEGAAFSSVMEFAQLMNAVTLLYRIDPVSPAPETFGTADIPEDCP